VFSLGLGLSGIYIFKHIAEQNLYKLTLLPKEEQIEVIGRTMFGGMGRSVRHSIYDILDGNVETENKFIAIRNTHPIFSQSTILRDKYYYMDSDAEFNETAILQKLVNINKTN